jgi:serine phosphatase RsbU (regulator of sigma subunit)/putative methionine-R-sulfoxide reductase with GAF domain
LVYSLLIGLTGLGFLIFRLLSGEQGLVWLPILAFAALSLIIQRVSFHVGSPSIHGLSGVVDIAAILALGPLNGAFVASLSSAAYLEYEALYCRRLSRYHLVELPLFSAGLKAWLALLGAMVFLELDGPLPISDLGLQTAIAVGALCVTWFVLEHAAWAGFDLLEGGRDQLRLYFRNAFPQPLVIELLSLAFSAVVALVYTQLGWMAFGLLTLIMVAAALLLQRRADTGSQLERLVADEHKRVRQLETIGQVSRQLTAAQELNELFTQVVHLIRESFGYYHVAIYTADRERQTVAFQASASAGQEGVAFDVAWGEGLIGWVAVHGQAITVNDVEGESRYRSVETLPETRSELAAPLLLDDELVGVLDVQSNQANAFGPDDLFITETLGAAVAVAIQQARLYEAERQQAWLSTALLQVADAMSRLSDMDAVLTSIVRLTPILVGVDRCTILLWDAEEEVYVPAQSYGFAPELREALEAMTFSEGAVPALDRLRVEKNPLLVNPVREPALVPGSLAESFDIQELAVLPLLAQGELLGAMLVDYAGKQHHFDERLIGMLTGIANQAAIVIHSARLVQAQREEAYVSMALLQVAEAVHGTTDLAEILATIVRITPILVGVEACAVFLWDPDTALYVPFQQYGLRGEERSAFLQLRFLEEEPLVAELAKGQPVLDIAGLAASAVVSTTAPGALVLALGRDALMALPMLAKGGMVGFMAVEYPKSGRSFARRWLGILNGIAGQAAIAVENDRLLRNAAEQQRIKQELEVARRIQASFMPECCPQIPGWELAAVWRSARQVSGDFYDFIPLPPQSGGQLMQQGRLGLVIADVADKGVPAALFMALARTLVRTVATDEASPALTIARSNGLILDDARAHLFVTLLYAILQSGSGEVVYVNAGHMPPLVVRAIDGATEELSVHGIALGVLPDAAFEETSAHLEPGDVLVLYTDGVTDASDPAFQRFGRDRLKQVANAHRHLAADELVEVIAEAIAAFVGDAAQFDDITLVVAKRSA